MSKDYKADLTMLQDNVFREYEFLKLLKKGSYESFQDSWKGKDDSPPKKNFFMRMIWKIFSKIVDFFNKKALHNFENYEGRNLVETTKTIILNQIIQKELCSKFAEEIKPDLSNKEKEIKVTRIVISLLISEEIIKQHSLILEPKLFAYIVYEIMQIGIDNYCG